MTCNCKEIEKAGSEENVIVRSSRNSQPEEIKCALKAHALNTSPSIMSRPIVHLRYFIYQSAGFSESCSKFILLLPSFSEVPSDSEDVPFVPEENRETEDERLLKILRNLDNYEKSY